MLVFSVFVYILTFDIEREFFVRILDFLQKFQSFQFAKLTILFAIIFCGLVWDILRISSRKKLDLAKQREKSKIFQLAMRTVQNIVGNFLNNLSLFVMQAEESRALDEDSIEELKRLIQTTSNELNKLADFTTIIEQDNNHQVHIIDMDKSH